VVLLADERTELNARMAASLLHHTTVPLRCVLLASSRAAVGALQRSLDPRLAVVEIEPNRGTAAAYNAGLASLPGDEDYLAFARSVEFLANWWEPYVAALDADRQLALTAERQPLPGTPPDLHSPPATSGAVGQRSLSGLSQDFFMTSRRAVTSIGGFLHSLEEHDALAEYLARVRRFGFRAESLDGRGIVRLETPRQVRSPLHLPERDSSTVPQAPFVVLVDAPQALRESALLGTFNRAFTAEDEAILVLYGPGLEHGEFVARLQAAAREAEVDLEAGPRIVAMLPETHDALQEAGLAAETCAILGQAPDLEAFAHLPIVALGDADALRLRAASYWRARHRTTSLATGA
jgi:hypothetical protein